MRDDNFFNNENNNEMNNNAMNSNNEMNQNDVIINNSVMNSNDGINDSIELRNNEMEQKNQMEEIVPSNTTNFIMYSSNDDSNLNEVRNDVKTYSESETEQVKDTYSNNEEKVNNEDSVNQSNASFVNEKKVKIPKMKKARKFFKKVAGLMAAAAVFGMIAGGTFQFVNQGGFKKNVSVVETNQGDVTDSASEDQSTNGGAIATSTTKPTVMDVSSVVENAMPAIVAINSSSTQTEYDFFGRAYENEVSGSGSGIIIGQNDNEILIATNNHVVSGATAIEIVFNDDTKAIAKLKGAEPSSDLAVVAVDINDLTQDTRNNIKIATLGNSDEVKTGELAIAIGNALGYGQSVTVGYISALNREVSVEDTTLNLLQTDAAINPGNSGGALLNANGEVIGINSVKYADTSVEGIGYAIPISDAIPIINDLMNREDLDESESAYLGIQPKTVDESYAQAFNMPVGVYVLSVVEGSPAEAAGLHKGDIITSINGKTIKDADQLQSYLSYTRAGTKVEVKVSVLENGTYTEKTLDVTLGNRPTQSR